MKVLAIDTASDSLDLALENAQAFFSTTSLAGRRYSEELVPRMIAMCAQGDLALSDLDLLVCANGPGSFTGLRVGMAAVKGVALGASIPLVSLSTMEVYQYPLKALKQPVVPVLDAKKDRFYCAIFIEGQRITSDLDSTPEEFADLVSSYPSIVVTGPDAALFAPLLEEALQKRHSATLVCPDHLSHRDYGEALIQLGKALLKSRGPDDIGMGPTYIRKCEAELSLEAREAHP
ncbi:MAG: tRNA (adenosine(37)-N6)-threonylcarbamoyltransferase complex dimerization subunit type 1 TsaB [Sphaerochaetaceae bacterium]